MSKLVVNEDKNKNDGFLYPAGRVTFIVLGIALVLFCSYHFVTATYSVIDGLVFSANSVQVDAVCTRVKPAYESYGKPGFRRDVSYSEYIDVDYEYESKAYSASNVLASGLKERTYQVGSEVKLLISAADPTEARLDNVSKDFIVTSIIFVIIPSALFLWLGIAILKWIRKMKLSEMTMSDGSVVEYYSINGGHPDYM